MANDAPKDGDNASEQLLGLVYDELRQLATAYLARERNDHTLQPTALVHEAYVKLAPQDMRWSSRAQFMGVAAVAMRRVLVDHARKHRSMKRGGEVHRVELDLSIVSDDEGTIDLVRLDEALTGLSTLSPRQARVVELRFFGGLTGQEVADVIEISPSTVESDWRFARAWLKNELRDGAH